MTVGLCDSVHHHSLFSTGENNNTIVIYVPSDKYGYPRLVATHYIPANEVHDTLADWAFYKRVDAQIDWLVSRTWSDYNTEEFAYIHLTDNDLLTDMGCWRCPRIDFGPVTICKKRLLTIVDLQGSSI